MKYTNLTEKSLNKYFNELNKLPVLSAEDELELAIMASEGNVEPLVKANLNFVITIAKEYVNKDILLADLISEGNYGLIVAAHRFDHTRGFRFISYAVSYVRKYMMEYIINNGHIIRIPANKFKDREMYLPTAIWSMDKTFPDMFGNPTSLYEYTEDKSSIRPDHDITLEDDKRIQDHTITKLLGLLTDRQQEVVKMYYGIGYDKPIGVKKIAIKLGLTHQAVTNSLNNALKKMQDDE